MDNCELAMQGTVQIADFGLARIFQDPLRPLCDDGDVVTIWYRAPELLLGSKHYTRAVDVWAVGAIFGELFHLGAIFPGKDNPQRGALQTDQLERIFYLLGKPSPSQWPEIVHCPFWKEVKDWENKEFQSRLADVLHLHRHSKVFDLMANMLHYDPNKRITAEQALEHPFFKGRFAKSLSIVLI
jgi:cyclin-dependent kinase 8/11